MPVAKLSREFYEKFGDKLTDELVNCLNAIEASYRAELRELFDAHFGRFEEKLERRLLDTKAELGIKIEQLRVELGDTLLELRVEPPEVQLIQLSQVTPIRRIHLVEPLHELGCDLVAESVVELAGKLRSDWHDSLVRSRSPKSMYRGPSA